MRPMGAPDRFFEETPSKSKVYVFSIVDCKLSGSATETQSLAKRIEIF